MRLRIYFYTCTEHKNKLMKVAYIDVETTGVNNMKHSIHQLVCIVEVDGVEVDKIEIKMKPHDKAVIEPKALEIAGVTEGQIRAYTLTQSQALKNFKQFLGKHVDQFDKKDKLNFVGYNSRTFDEVFVRTWFELWGDNYFNSWFWPIGVDVAVLAAYNLMSCRDKLENFKLGTVVQYYGLAWEESKAHDAGYGIEKTRELFKLLNNPLVW